MSVPEEKELECLCTLKKNRELPNWMGKKKKQKQKVSTWEREPKKTYHMIGCVSWDIYCIKLHAMLSFHLPKKIIYSYTFWVRCDRICWLPETEVNQVGFATLGARCQLTLGVGPTSFQSPLFLFSHISNQKVFFFFFFLFFLNNQKARLIFDRDVLSS